MALFRRAKPAPRYSENELRAMQQHARDNDPRYRDMQAATRLNRPDVTAPMSAQSRPAPRPQGTTPISMQRTRPLPPPGMRPIDRTGAPPRYVPHATRGDYVEDRTLGEQRGRAAAAERTRLMAENQRRAREIEQMEAEIERRKREVAEMTRRHAAAVAAYRQSVLASEPHQGFARGRYSRALAKRAGMEALTAKRA